MHKLILLGVIWLAVASGAFAIELNAAYFEPIHEGRLDQPSYRELLAAITDIPDSDDLLTNLETLKKTETDLYKRIIYSDFSDLASLNERSYIEPASVQRLVRLYVMAKEIYRKLKGKNQDDPRLSKVKVMVDYLDQQANSGKFSLCLRGSMQEIGEIVAQLKDDEAALDEFVSTAYGLEDPNDEKLFNVAKAFDIADDELSIKRLLKLTKKGSKESKIERLLNYFNKICSPLRTQMNLVVGYFGLYNIVQAAGGSEAEKMPMQFKKLNEYNRLCLMVTDHARRATKGAIGKRLDRFGISCFN